MLFLFGVIARSLFRKANFFSLFERGGNNDFLNNS